jgi:site-specific recombinase XerD
LRLNAAHLKLAHKGGAKLEEIQLSLGHASLTTTERYLGVHQDLHDAPCDFLKLDLASEE